jgi:hypothetical protein
MERFTSVTCNYQAFLFCQLQGPFWGFLHSWVANMTLLVLE